MAKETVITDHPRPLTIGEEKTVKFWPVLAKYINDFFEETPNFTGKLEINFKDGKLMDINETKRTKF